MSTLTDNENKELLQQVIAPLNTRMKELEASLLSYHPKRTKLSTRVEFDYTWELIDSDNTVKIYSLYAVVCHSGGVSGGHYTAYCNYCGVWRCFDDKIVKSVTWEYVAHQEAYILFYKL